MDAEYELVENRGKLNRLWQQVMLRVRHCATALQIHEFLLSKTRTMTPALLRAHSESLLPQVSLMFGFVVG